MRGVIPLLRAAQAHCVCPICLYLLQDPTALPCGHVFCRSCLSRSLHDRCQCPLCNRVSSSRRSLIPLPNLALFTSLIRRVVDRAMTEVTAGERSPPSLRPPQKTPTAGMESPPSTPPAKKSAAGVSRAAETPATAGVGNSRPSGSLLLPKAPPSLYTQMLSMGELSPPSSFDSQLPRASLSMSTGADGAKPASREQTPCDAASGPTPPVAASSCPSPHERFTDELLANSALTPVLSQKLMQWSPEDSGDVEEGSKEAVLAAGCGGLTAKRPGGCLFIPPLQPSWEETGEATGHAFAGCCVLCGLDTTDHEQTRGFLLSLLNSTTAHCEAGELADLTEGALEAMLGPLWGVVIAADGEAESAPSLAVRAHHNCLAWVGLLPEDASGRHRKGAFTSSLAEGGARAEEEGAFVVSVPATLGPALVSLTANLFRKAEDTAAEGESAVQLACAVCRRTEAFSVAVRVLTPSSSHTDSAATAVASLPPTLGLRRCQATAASPVCSRQPRAFHLPCALLAGADVCLVLGLDAEDSLTDGVEVWCGACRRKKRRRDA